MKGDFISVELHLISVFCTLPEQFVADLIWGDSSLVYSEKFSNLVLSQTGSFGSQKLLIEVTGLNSNFLRPIQSAFLDASF